MMKTKKILLFVVFAVLLLSVIGCSNKSPEYEPPKVEVLINGASVELTPDVDVHNGNAGGIWDSPANELPMAFVSNEDTISVVFLDEAPRSVRIQKYDVFDLEDVIGNPNARSGPIGTEAIYQEAAVSFHVVQGKSAQQLITVIGEWDTQEVQYAFVVSIEDDPEQTAKKATLEQALQEYAMQIVPGDGFHFGWKQLAEEESGEKGTAYGVILFHSSSGSPLIFSEKTGYYCSAIYSTYLLPISVSYEKDAKGRYAITDCWMPSKESYEQDLLAHFPPETADLVFENLDQYTTEILEEIAEHDAERVQVFFPGGPVWPAYSFNEELDNPELCGLAGYYPVGDIYYEPVWNEVLRRFQNDSVALLKGLSLCNEETQSTVRSFIAAEVGASKLEASLLALKSEDEVQVPAEQVEKGPIKPAEPPAEGEVPIKIFEPADVEFSGQTLTAYLDTMTYQERLVWIETETEYTGGMNPISSGEYLEGQGCIAYIELWPGRGYFDENLVIRFADGTQASLLLPRENGYADALPDSMKFQDGKFIYEITFPTEELTDEGQSLIHLKGIYHYEVDLPTKTLSLTIIQ